MVAACLAVLVIALSQIGAIVRRAYVSPAGVDGRDLLVLALAVGVALGAWAVGLIALAMGVAKP